MTDQEVKKGLECCTCDKCTEQDCPYHSFGDCHSRVEKDALALINRLEEEKEQIRKEVIKEAYEWMRDNAVYSEEEGFSREFAEAHGVEVDE